MAFEIMGKTVDRRTESNVLYCKCSINDYLELVGENFEGYSIQRKRENHKAYQRLKDDLVEGALLPSITLALKPELVAGAVKLIDDIPRLQEYVNRRGQADILDGLQRTYLMKDLMEDKIVFPDTQEVSIEYWLESDISKLIYRMIVLNAGQKAMSMRHQIELLFMSLKGIISEEIDNIDIFLERETARRTSPNKYSLSVIASAYQAFLTRSAEIDKNDLVSNALVKETVMDATEQEHTQKFNEFISYFKKIKEIDELSWHYYNGKADDTKLNDLVSKNDEELLLGEKAELYRLKVFKNAKTWLGSDNVMLGLYGSIAQLLNTGRKDRLDNALVQLKTMFVSGEDDPLGLVSYERTKSEINPKKYNVGNATRKLLLNGFKEYFRDEGETNFAQCWEQAKDW